MEKVTMKFDGIEVINIEGYDDGYYWDVRVIYKYKDHVFEYVDVGSGSGYINPAEGITMLAGPDEELPKNWKEEFTLYDGYIEDMSRFNASTLIAAAEFLLKTGRTSEDLYVDPFGGGEREEGFDQDGYLIAWRDFTDYDDKTPEFDKWFEENITKH